MSELHSSIIALVSLASGISSNHPAMGQCQLAKLRHMGIAEDQINTVIEIARHIRDESSEILDLSFDQKYKGAINEELDVNASEENKVCCSSTDSGQSCC